MIKTIITLGLVIAAGVLFFLYTKPTYDSLQTRKSDIETYNLALEKAGELQQLKQELLARYQSFSPADIDRLHKLLPDHVDNVRLVLDLDNLASKHGLALQNIAVSAVSRAAQGQEAIIGASLATYDSVTMSFETTGPYDRFVGLLTDLEHSLRIVDVEQLGLDAADKTGTNYRFNVSLRTYWLK